LRRPRDVDVPRLLARLGIDARRKGRDLWARCPHRAHEDRSPSWHMRDSPGHKHGAHHCFSCAFGGSPNDLVAHVLGLSWREAEAWLTEQPGAVDRRPLPRESEVRLILPARFRLPAGVEVAPLESWPSFARRYIEARGIPDWQVARWGVGYAVGGTLGGRVVFVKRRHTGEVGGYSARTFSDAAKRYDEPSAWARAVPGLLFGEEHWPERSIRAREAVLVAEGCINALACERIATDPFPFVAAMSGSELHPIAAEKLTAWGVVVVVSDPDAAGDKLERQIREACAPSSARVIRARLRDGTDAASIETSELQCAVFDAVSGQDDEEAPWLATKSAL
jgi:DNA primase